MWISALWKNIKKFYMASQKIYHQISKYNIEFLYFFEYKKILHYLQILQYPLSRINYLWNEDAYLGVFYESKFSEIWDDIF